jgi:YhcH/YjgK/YiaL family protein
MKKIYLIAALFLSITNLSLSAQSGNSEWTERKAKKWFKKKEYLAGLKATPHAAISKLEFAKQYHLSKTWWDKAFAFLRDSNLVTLTNGRHNIDGDNVYALVTEAPSKDYDKTAFEAHKNFTDIHYVIMGVEKMGKTPAETLKVDRPYNERGDITYYIGDGEVYTIEQNGFLIFFPGEGHRPNITPGGNKVVKKVVIKIRAVKS